MSAVCWAFANATELSDSTFAATAALTGAATFALMVYFNAIFALAVAGAYFATGFQPLLLVVLVQNFPILHQLLPPLRLDGYYIISGLTGVPDMLARIKPVLLSMLPGREADPRVAELKPWVRAVVTGYVCTIVPVLILSFVLMIVHAPRAFATAYDSAGVQWDKIAAAPGMATAATGVVQLALLVLPCLGMVLTSGRVGGRVCRSAWCWSEGEPLRRGVLGISAVGAVGLAAFVWWPNGDYRPIQPTERGTVQAAVRDLRALPTGRPALTVQRQRDLGGAPFERPRRRAQLPAQDKGAAKAKTKSTPSETTTTTPSATTTTTTPSATTTTTTTSTSTTDTTSTTPTTPTDTTTLPTDTTTTTVPGTTTRAPGTATTRVPGPATTPATTAPPAATTPAATPPVTTTTP